MKFQELIRRALAGEPLNALERAELEQCNIEQLQQENSQLKQQLTELSGSQLSAEEKLRQELKELAQERDAAQHSRDQLCRQIRIRELADHYGCRDAAYFDFRAAQADLDLSDQAAVDRFAEQLAATSAHCFNAPVAPGGGAGTAEEVAPGVSPATGNSPDRIEQIVFSLGNAPEVR